MKPFNYRRWLIGEEADLLIDDLALLGGSGMDTVSALAALKRETRNKPLKRVIGQIALGVENGLTLSKALAETNLWSPSIIALIKIGEETGRLPESLTLAAQTRQKEKDFRAKINSAMMYPVLVLTLTLVMGLAISWLILPRLAVVFSQLRVDLPWITKLLINGGVLLGKYGFILLPLGILTVAGMFYLLFGFSRTKFIGERLLFSLPFMGRLLAQVEVSRFGFLLGTMLTAGLPLITALDSLIGVTEVAVYRRFYLRLRVLLEEGNSFAKGFGLIADTDRLLPPAVQQMIVAAEQSGSLPEMLLKIAEQLERRSETTAKNIGTILEPALLIVVWVAVAAVAIAIILPIYSLIGGFSP